MTRLTQYSDDNPNTPMTTTDNPTEIEAILNEVGITFRQWPTLNNENSTKTGSELQDEILTFYNDQIQHLKEREGYTTADVISLTPAHPDKRALREKFLDEHTHSEDEVRFFVRGCGLFSLHINNKVYSLLCKKGDLINVPANTAHWFDMGPEPSFTCIRLFTNPDGWVAQYTQSDIAKQFPRLSV